MLGNKPGLTLLNCGLQILTKLVQLPLTVVLQDFIILNWRFQPPIDMGQTSERLPVEWYGEQKDRE